MGQRWHMLDSGVSCICLRSARPVSCALGNSQAKTQSVSFVPQLSVWPAVELCENKVGSLPVASEICLTRQRCVSESV